jgi:hypothetical protein
MSATELSGGEFEPDPVVWRHEGDRRRREQFGGRANSSLEPDPEPDPRPEIVLQAPPEPEQQPALLGLVDRFVELLNALWDRLTSL